MMSEQQEEYIASKRRLSEVQLKIKKSLSSDSLPSDEDAGLFTELSNEMLQLSQPEWQAAMQVYMEQLQQFQSAREAQDLAGTKHAFAGLMDAKAAGHTEFRKK